MVNQNNNKKKFKKADKADAILNAAIVLFAQKGFYNTKISDIAQSAGIGKGTVYEYFSSKEDILCDVIDIKIRDEYKQREADLEQCSTAKEKLCSYLGFELQFVTDYKLHSVTIQKSMMSWDNHSTERLNDCISSLIGLHLEAIYKIMKEGIERGEFRNVDPLLSSHLLLHTSLAFFTKLMTPMPDDPHITHQIFDVLQGTTFDELIDMVLNGIMA